MAFNTDLSPGASISMAPQRRPVFAQSSISPVSAHSVSVKGHQTFSSSKREPAELNPAHRLSQSNAHADLKIPTGSSLHRQPSYQASEFFIQERAKVAADELRVSTGGDKPRLVTPSFQRFGYQDASRPQREKQFSPGSGKSQPSIASTHRSPRHGRRPGLMSHQVTSAQPKLPQRAEPSHQDPASLFLGSARGPDQANKPDHSSPVPLGDLDHSMKGSPLLFARHPSRRVAEPANRPLVPDPIADPRSAAPLRPNSRESNISKRRVNPGRVSFPFHGDEMADLEHFGSAWNHYLQNHARRSENAATRMLDLEKKLEEKAKSIKEHTVKCTRQSEAIAGLERQVSELTALKRKLAEENETAKKQLEKNEAKREEMQSKMRSYREKLNEAITEQQDLYLRSKNFCDAAIDDVRKTQEQAEADHRAATEMVAEGAQKAADARREMKALLEGELKDCQLLRNTGKSTRLTIFAGGLTLFSRERKCRFEKATFRCAE